MADVYFNCACGKSLAIDEKGVGLSVACVDCGRPVRVPEREMEFICERCRCMHLAPLALVGSLVECTRCGHRIRVRGPDVDRGAAEYVRSGPARRGVPGRLGRGHQPAGVGGSLRRLPVFRPAFLALMAGSGLVAFFIVERRLCQDEQRDSPIPAREALAQKTTAPGAPEPAVQEAQKMNARGSKALPPVGAQPPACPPVGVSAPPASELPEHFAMPRPPETHPAVKVVAAMAPASGGNAAGGGTASGPVRAQPGKTAQAPPQEARPERELMRKFMELDALRVKRPSDPQPSEYLQGLRQFRAVAEAYGREHAGKELEAASWNVIFKQMYYSLFRYDCRTYAQSERLMREGIDLLAKIDHPNWRWPHILMMDLVTSHVEQWQDREPFLTADIMDAAAADVLALKDGDLTNYWYWKTDVVLNGFLWRCESMAPGQREKFYVAREKALLDCLDNEMVVPARRSNLLSDCARYMVRNGRPDRAAKLVREWRRKHGPAAYSPRFFRIWMETALFAEGDWEEAEHALREAAQCAATWTKPYDLQQFETVCQIYYRSVFWPGIELKRRRWEEVEKSRGPG
ncbi:MAG: hypothetical protein GX608_01920 [Lentisphaerae bacterium]|nr:hypothetical protein [Lentisphaerota bacterium]